MNEELEEKKKVTIKEKEDKEKRKIKPLKFMSNKRQY